jgi:hypothetical protein
MPQLHSSGVRNKNTCASIHKIEQQYDELQTDMHSKKLLIRDKKKSNKKYELGLNLLKIISTLI